MITLNTIAYEGNFEKLLSSDSWFFKFNSNLITNKTITINNIVNKNKFNTLLNEMSIKHVFDVIYVELDELNKVFNLNINQSTLGYNYTIPYFAAINKIETPFILNIASDCMDDIYIDDEYLNASIEELQNNKNCLSTMVAWTKNNYVMSNGKKIGEYEEDESFKIIKNNPKLSNKFNYRFNFTDQFFMASIDELKKLNYNIDESHSNKIYFGPQYGGNSFEKRMASNQVYNNQYNCVFKGNQYYIHDKNYY